MTIKNVKHEVLGIFHVITTLERGGAENQLLTLVRAQVKVGHNVTVIPLKGKAELDERFKDAGATVVKDCRDLGILGQALAIRKLLPKSRHILHAHLPQAEIVGRISLKASSLFVVTRHFGGQFYPRHSPRFSRSLSRLATSRAKAVIAISQAVEQQLILNSEVHKSNKIRIVHYGFDCLEFKREAHTKFDIGKGNKSIVLGTIARFSEEKDYPTLFFGLKKLLELGHDVHLRIVGAGHLEYELKELVLKLRIEDKISWEGRISNTYDFLKELDIFVLTSKFEGFGMVLVEAMCANCRIVASGNTAILEVLGNRGAGALFETGDVGSLVAKILQVKEISKDQFAATQAFQLKLFSVDRLIKETTRIYDQIVNDS